MMKNKGFTLIELMVVMLIVAILAAVLVPIMRGRLDAAKWSEGKAGAGTIATAVRAYCVEQGKNIPGQLATPDLATLGFTTADLQGKYFALSNYTLSAVTYDEVNGTMTYTITVNKPATISTGGPWQLDQAGNWTENPGAGAGS